jgi:hypothetical protein
MFTSRNALLLPCLFSLTGCNQILGIHQPAAEVWIDGGAVDYDAAVGPDVPQAGSGWAGDAGDATPVNQLPRSDHASPTWPMPNPVASQLTPLLSYGAAQAGVVPDNVTKLEWQQHIDDTARTWAEATAYCDALEMAGADDWRLPSRIELISLVDFSRVNPSIDLGAFPDAAS